jgi:hypothetical protein
MHGGTIIHGTAKVEAPIAAIGVSAIGKTKAHYAKTPEGPDLPGHGRAHRGSDGRRYGDADHVAQSLMP